ncbi:hypothetical protein B0T36_14095 [Nocardia donostiensis]|uniref:hypothetical protein n=1 Tax=Nocardia donostiensis TaxID=1538463 RepID=UPI0009DA8979|nr:hypothetical protein [Nocardia donostiensis]OQS14630.1 hypothetical protein B0T36_14095 [Nocardia donostiensis]
MTIGIGSSDWVPDACTLPTNEQPLRVAEFDEFFGQSVRRFVRAAPERLDLVIEPGSEAAGRELAERETQCCSFFGFGFGTDGDETVMRIGVPTAHIEVLDAIESRVAHLLDGRGQ